MINPQMVKKSSSLRYSSSQTKVIPVKFIHTPSSNFLCWGKRLYLDFKKVYLMMYGNILFNGFANRNSIIRVIKISSNVVEDTTKQIVPD